MIPTALVLLTRPPTGTPRRAICPDECLPIHHIAIRERPRPPSTARIGRAPLHRARSASREGAWPLPPPPSEAARCASTEDHQVPSPLFFSLLLNLHPLNFFVCRHQLVSDLHHQLKRHISFL
jgi:hypothetical protein